MTSHFNAELIWQSDWNGEELGYDDILVVGLYHIRDTNTYVYLNTETGDILESWEMDDEE